MLGSAGVGPFRAISSVTEIAIDPSPPFASAVPYFNDTRIINPFLASLTASGKPQRQRRDDDAFLKISDKLGFLRVEFSATCL